MLCRLQHWASRLARDPGAIMRTDALPGLKELILLKPHPDAPLFDHSWQSPTFEKQIKFIIQEYKECNGEYSEES